MIDDEKVRKADHAKRLLEDKELKGAINKMRQTCYSNIETSNHGQKDEREDLYYMLRCISAFERALEATIRDGKTEMLNLNVKRLIK